MVEGTIVDSPIIYTYPLEFMDWYRYFNTKCKS